jgi:hypothetical protein
MPFLSLSYWMRRKLGLTIVAIDLVPNAGVM